MKTKTDFIQEAFRRSAEVKLRMADTLSESLARAARILIHAITNGGKILWCGNGGSAADAQHLSTELVCRLRLNRPPVASLALTTDTSLLTAHSNDFGFEHVFARQVEALGNPGDVLVAISTSGRSPNVLAAVQVARQRGLQTIGLTGKDGGALKDLCHLSLVVPSEDTQNIQESHITIGHILCDLLERELWGTPGELNA